MVIRGHYVGLPVSDLNSIRDQLLQSLEKARLGSRFEEVDMGGKMGKKALLSYNEIVHELKEVEHALKKAMPEVYGRSIKRLVPNHNPALVRMVIKLKDGKETYYPEEEFIDTGAIAYDPVEGDLTVTRISDPIMNHVGVQYVDYEAYNSKGVRIKASRKIEILGSVEVFDLAPIFGNSVNDDIFYYNRGVSTINLTNGYWADKDYQNQIVKENNRWSIYDYSGVVHDSQKSNSTTPLTSETEWGKIIVK
jgi:hypothetical protein